jgi:hypothetical protein
MNAKCAPEIEQRTSQMASVFFRIPLQFLRDFLFVGSKNLGTTMGTTHPKYRLILCTTTQEQAKRINNLHDFR